MSALRILVPIKRVIDYAVSPPPKQIRDDWPPTVLGESTAQHSKRSIRARARAHAHAHAHTHTRSCSNYIYTHKQKLNILPD
jgi:hypothetical protein